MSDASIVDIGSAKRRAPGNDRLHIKITADGGLELRISRGPVYVVAPDVTEKLLEQLVIGCRRARYRKLGLPADQPPEAARACGPGPCHRRRDGGLQGGPGGCRRRRKHTGQCRDKDGNYTPAICSHIGRRRTTIWIVGKAGERLGFLHCSHCNGEVGPVPPDTSCPL